MHSLQTLGVICSVFISPSWKVLVFLVCPCNTTAASPSVISAALFHNCSVSSREFRMNYCTSVEGSLRLNIAVKLYTVLISKLSDHVWQFFAFLTNILHWTNCLRELKSVISLKFSFLCCNYKIFEFSFLQLHYCTLIFNEVHLTHFWPSLNFARCFKFFFTSVPFEIPKVHELGAFIANSLLQVINGVE